MSQELPLHRLWPKLLLIAVLLASIVVLGLMVYGAFDQKPAVRGSSGPLTEEPTK